MPRRRGVAITGDERVTGFRGAGTADVNASRTGRRCIENRRANSRTDTSGSRRRALRICSNNSTFNLLAMNPTVHDQPAAEVDPTLSQVGPNQTSKTGSSCDFLEAPSDPGSWPFGCEVE